MNTAEALYYPKTYYEDITAFCASYMTALFAADGPYIAEQHAWWQFRLESRIQCILLDSRLDDSVPLGAMVLLENLVRKGRQQPLQLPPYPHEDYFGCFYAAFMHAYQILCHSSERNTIHKLPLADFWLDVLGKGVFSLPDLERMEDNIISQLTPAANSGKTTPQTSSLLVRTGARIHPQSFLNMKANMYAFIYLRMSLRLKRFCGPPDREWPLEFPPCHEEMMKREETFSAVKVFHPAWAEFDDRTFYKMFVGGLSEIKDEFLQGMRQGLSYLLLIVLGTTWEGTPQGKWEKIGGVDCYVGTPSVDYPKDKAILFLSDVFGPQLVNAQLMVDDFAANGFKVCTVPTCREVPDQLRHRPDNTYRPSPRTTSMATPSPPDAMNPGKTYDITKWFPSHGPEQTRPTLDKVINALKEQGITVFGATGYCFGGRYVFDLAFDNVIQASVASHPSLLQVPADLEKYAAQSKAPLLLNTCPVDQQFPLESSALADSILGDGKFAPGYKREFFEGVVHGFAVRGDVKDPKVKAGKEGAFKAAVEWFVSKL
ncbi:hypothetical protein NLJ89_g3420 [Agrocybe chaxingu]|uniref:Dienelactone hydrolase domain-containing protein n=1 Tax=Agrocybe chaxingu TaxID=84603 RepID=A0A9W8KB30_9AGAR|nr:hypothetical protein NLJ89_g3420 [Agrocybe chaxingu]